MGILGWDVDAEATRTIITAAVEDIDELPGIGDTMVEKFTASAEACDHIAIGAALDSVLTTYVSPLHDAAHAGGHYVLSQLETAVQAYLDGDRQMGEAALGAVDEIPDWTGEEVD